MQHLGRRLPLSAAQLASLAAALPRLTSLSARGLTAGPPGGAAAAGGRAGAKALGGSGTAGRGASGGGGGAALGCAGLLPLAQLTGLTSLCLEHVRIEVRAGGGLGRAAGVEDTRRPARPTRRVTTRACRAPCLAC